MPLFVLIGWDGPNGVAVRQTHRPAHLDRLKALDAEGRVRLGGPLTDGAGSLLVIDFADQAQAEAWMAEDPYLKAGGFARTEVHPFVAGFPQTKQPA